MSKKIKSLLLFFFCFFAAAHALALSHADAQKVGDKIWKNECGGKIAGLTHWNKGENFASLGIGHFIWYPEGRKERFQETFPALLAFLRQEGAALPDWLLDCSYCPWNSRAEFLQEMHSPKMQSLRQFLYETRHLQLVFIANRLEKTLPEMLERCSSSADKNQVSTHFYRLSQDPNGLYALLDYLNFKGSGTAAQETYKGQGWGLLQVLQRMPASSPQPVADFVDAAKFLLKQRVHNAPPERHEEQWLKGWLNRVDTYVF